MENLSITQFALKLPHNWWMWGTDVQLASDIDRPQRAYFEKVASEEMQAGDRIILCTAEPTWVYSATDGPEAYDNLKFFENNIIREHGGILAVALAGDLHHYCRYEAPNTDDPGEKRQRITAGGGGAFLYGTGDMPETLDLDEGDAGPVKYSQAEDATFPSKSTSRRLSVRGLLFPFKNWRVSLLIGGLYLLFTWLLQSPSGGAGDPTFMQKISELDGLGNMLEAFFSTIAYSPTNVVFVFGLIGGLYSFCAAKSWYGRLLLGVGHAILHLLLNLLLIWCFSVLNPRLLGVLIGTVGNFVLVIIEMFIVGSLLGGMLMGLYLLIANLIGRFTPGGIHTNELFSSMQVEAVISG
jgi:hypothetical protein